jgi:hypothetical protein
MKYTIDNRLVYKWENVPNVWKVVKKVNGVKVQPNPTDDGLQKLLKPFTSTDPLRSNMTAINFDEKCIVATNTNILVSIVNSGNFRGLFKDGKELNEKYPNYEQVFPTEDQIKVKSSISLYKLKTYCEACIKGKYVSEVTNKIVTKLGEFSYSFNVDLMLTILDFYLKLGYERVSIFAQSDKRALVFNGDVNFPILGKDVTCLLMPIYNNENTALGAEDVDMDSALYCYYDLLQDAIINQDGSIADFKMNVPDYMEYLTNTDMKLLKKVISSKVFKRVPITEYVKVENSRIVATDLESSISIGCQIEDGIYELCNGALKSTTEKLDNFVTIDETTKEFLFETISDYLYPRIDAIKNFVSDDDLRPALKGVHFFITDDATERYMEATDSRVVMRTEISNPFVKTPCDFILRNPKLFSDFLEVASKDDVKSGFYECNTSGYYEVICGKYIYRFRNIDEALYPKIDSIILQDADATISFNQKKMADLLSLVKGKDKNNVFSVSNIEQNSVGNADVMLYEQEKPYKFIKKLGEIEYSNIDSPNPKRFVTKNTRTNTNFMVIMPFRLNDDSKDKSFVAKYLQLINTYTKHELRLFYDSSKFSGLFMTELIPEEVFKSNIIIPQPKAPKPTSQPNEDADLVMAKIVKLGKLRDITDMQEEKEFYQDKINKLQKLFNILTK